MATSQMSDRELHLALDGFRRDDRSCISGLSISAISQGVLNEGGYTNSTLLMLAARMGAKSCMHELIESGAGVNLRDSNGQTAMFYAVCSGNTGAVDELIRYGASVNARDKKGLTPLMLAVRLGDYGMVQHLLLRAARASERDDENVSVLSHALSANKSLSTEMLNLLIENGADAMDVYRNGLPLSQFVRSAARSEC